MSTAPLAPDDASASTHATQDAPQAPSRRQLAWRIATCLLMLVPIALADAWLAQGPKRRVAYHVALERRLADKPSAQVAILGQSTIDQWLGEKNLLAKLLGRPGTDVVNAAIGGCDYTCSFSEVRHLLAMGRHFEEVYFGANLYQMCEDAASWRLQTPLALIPRQDLPDLLALYLHAQKPLSYYARMLGMSVSEAYYDSMSVRRNFPGRLHVKPPRKGGPELGWSRKIRARIGWTPSCKYAPDEIALESAALRALLVDMARLSDRVFYLALPDRRRGDRAYAGVWRKFVTHQRALAHAAPHTTFVDLTSGGASAHDDFRDGAHLSGSGKKKQTALFKHKLAVLRKQAAEP